MKVERICKQCGTKFQARQADVNRGWALFHNKSCKAQYQENRTGQYKSYLCSRINRSNRNDDEDEDAYHVEDPSWDAHKECF